MILFAQSPYLYDSERLAIVRKEYRVRSRVCTFTPFFLNLYSRLSLTFAMISSLYMLSSPQYAFARSSQMV